MRHRNEYRRRVDAVSNYMQKFKVPHLVQDRVKLWMKYTWEQQKSFDENDILSFLPTKMRTDLALQVTKLYKANLWYILINLGAL